MAVGEWPEKTRLLVTIAVGALLSVGAWTGVYFGHKKYRKLQSNVAKLKKDIKNLEEEAKREPGLRMKKKRLEESQAKYLKKLPSEEEAAELIEQVSKIAQKYNVEQKSRKRIKSRERRGGATGPVGLQNFETDYWQTTWAAGFHEWCRFMNEVEEKYPRLIAFENLDIIAAGDFVLSGSKHNIKVKMATYRYKPQPTGGP